MNKCICGVDISPANVKDHQGCGIKMYNSEIDLASINELVAENKQRFIKFPYTGEVVDFLLANIDTLAKDRDELSIYYATVKNEACGFIAQNKALTKDRDEWKDSCIDGNTRFKKAEAKIKVLREELKLTEHKLITCGVAATHSNKDLSYRKADYGGKWDSPQAQSVRTLRARYEQALAATEKE